MLDRVNLRVGPTFTINRRYSFNFFNTLLIHFQSSLNLNDVFIDYRNTENWIVSGYILMANTVCNDMSSQTIAWIGICSRRDARNPDLAEFLFAVSGYLIFAETMYPAFHSSRIN